MEQDLISSTEILDRQNVNKMLCTRIAYLNKKRKLLADQLTMPLPKHVCSDRSFIEESDSSFKVNREGEESSTNINMEAISARARHDISELNHSVDSNSCSVDAASSFGMSISDETRTDMSCPISYLSDQPSTSSMSWGSHCSKNSLYSLESRSASKSLTKEMEPPLDRGGYDSGFSSYSALNYEEQLLEFESHIDCSYDAVERLTDKEIEAMLHSNGVIPSSYVLSSEKSSISPESQQGSKRLTIDKEFEEYFSSLML